MNVKASKQEARALEEKGDTAKALAVYREILDHLEGSQAMLRELPLLVKVGDLYLKQSDTKTALAMYDKAGRLYAKHGSGKSVIAVCGKILKVLPEGTHTHIHYARLLIEGGHVGEARKVLVNYAEAFELPRAQQALKVMEGKSDEEMAPMLEMVLEMAAWGEEEEAAAEPVAAGESSVLVELEEEPEETEAAPEVEAEATALDTLEPIDMQADVAQPDIAQPMIPGKEDIEIARGMTDMLEERPIQRTSIVTGDIASDVDEADAAAAEDSAAESESLIVKSGEGYDIEQASVPDSDLVPDEVSEVSAEESAEVHGPVTPVADAPPPTAGRDSGDVPALDVHTPDKPLDVARGLDIVEVGGVADASAGLRVDRFSDSGSMRPSMPHPSPARPSGSARASAAHPRPSTGHRRPSASHRGQGRGRGKPQPKEPHFLRNVGLGVAAIAIGVVLTRIVPYGGASQPDVVTPADSSADSAAVAAQGFRPPPAQAQPADSFALQQISLFDSVMDSIEVDLGALQAQMMADSLPGAALDVPIVGVDRLPIETVRALLTPGETGSRVIQVLDSGERLTLTVFPIPRAMRSGMPLGQVSVSTLADGTAEGTARVGNYEVRARAPINAELLEVLLGQVVEVVRN